MKGTFKQILALAVVTAITPAIPAVANSGLIKVTVAPDTPYRQKTAAAAPAGTFQIASVKMETPAASPNSVAIPYHMVRPHWR